MMRPERLQVKISGAIEQLVEAHGPKEVAEVGFSHQENLDIEPDFMLLVSFQVWSDLASAHKHDFDLTDPIEPFDWTPLLNSRGPWNMSIHVMSCELKIPTVRYIDRYTSFLF